MEPAPIHSLEQSIDVGLVRPTPRFPFLHATLLLLTALSLAVAGGLLWSPPDIEPDSLSTVSAWLRILAAGAPYAFWVLLILGAHEMGHYVACRRYGIPVTLPFFLPGLPPIGTFGAVLRIRGRIPDRRALFDVAAAGPLAGIAVALPVLVAGLLTARPASAAIESEALVLGAPLGWRWIASLAHLDVPPESNALIVAGWVGALFTSLNLFPVGQLDGGHVAYAVSRRLHRWLSYATLAGLAALVLIQVLVERQVPAYAVWLAILLWMRDRHPPVLHAGQRVGIPRTIVALLLAVIWLLCFIPLPLRVVGP